MSEGPIQKILDKTNGGLDIIISLVPEAADCVDKKNKKFKIVDEKTPSATISRLDNGIYWVKCFSSGFSGNAISLYNYLEGKDLKESIKILGARYGAFDEASVAAAAPRPKIERRQAGDNEIEGTYSFEIKDVMNDAEISAIFSKRTISFAASKNLDNKNWNEKLIATCAKHNVFALKSFTYIKKNNQGIKEAIVTSSTEEYPIFVIEGDGFKKIYQPKSQDKSYRFRYSGTKPSDYIFGYKRIISEYQRLIESENEKSQIAQSDVEDAPKRKRKEYDIKLDNIILCSGDADALNVAAMGYNVIWLNAEGSTIPLKVMNELRKMSHNIYNLPDIDVTGQREAHKKALEFFEMKTIALPAELGLKKDWRGNPCKDVRDYFNHYGKYEFEQLVKSALEYRFWDEQISYDREGNPKGTIFVYNDVRGLNFLSKCGFHRLRSKTSKLGYNFIQIVDNVVEVVEARDIKKFVVDYLKQHYTDNQKLRNTIIRSNRLKEDALENLEYIDIDFKYFDKGYQYFFFKNKTWEVSASGIQEFSNKQVSRMVWRSKVVPHNVHILPPAFEVIEKENPDKTISLDVKINNYDCMFMRYLINVSRIHWQVELETRLDQKFEKEEDRQAYREKNKFVLDGELLTKDEIDEQKAHFINKIYVLGYLLCRYKSSSTAWAPFIMDHVLSKEGESRGGSGKSMMLESLKFFLNTVEVDGKSKSLTDDKFAFEMVDENTEFVRIEDLSKYVPIEPFFNMITGGLTVNPKNRTRFTLDFAVSPHIAFTSNYGVRDLGPSSSRRIIYAACSDYYHNNANNHYRENRTVKDDFGKEMYRDFDEKDWINFSNTIARCLQVFFKLPMKVDPPMKNVDKRNLMGIMGDAFFQWAEVYFSEENDRLNCMVDRQDAFNDFIRNNNIPKAYGMQRFSHSVEAWCKYYNYVFNPDQLKNTQGRIIVKGFRKNADGSFAKGFKMKNGVQVEEFEKIAREMIYIQTTGQQLNKPAEQESIEPKDSPDISGGPEDDDLKF